MNKVMLIGRLIKDPDVRYSQGENASAVAKYTLAVDKRIKNNEDTADFIGCVCFGKNAEFAEKYLTKGTKIAVTGRISTGNYTNKEGQKVYTTEVVVEEHEFCETKKNGNDKYHDNSVPKIVSGDDFMKIEEELESGLPFN